MEREGYRTLNLSFVKLESDDSDSCVYLESLLAAHLCLGFVRFFHIKNIFPLHANTSLIKIKGPRVELWGTPIQFTTFFVFTFIKQNCVGYTLTLYWQIFFMNKPHKMICLRLNVCSENK